MKKRILSLLILAIGTVGTINAQFTSDSFYITKLIESEGEKDFELYGKVNGPLAKTDYTWSRTAISMPSDWAYAICDPFLCHSRTTDSASYFLDGGSNADMIVHFYVPHTSGGMGVVRLVNRDDSKNTTDTAIYVIQTYNTFLNNPQPDKLKDEVKVYPNPANTSKVNIVSTSLIQTVEVVNLTGQVVKTVVLNSPDHMYQLDVDDLSNGLYLVRVKSTGGTVQTTKVEVSK